jgi:hypothetical protein
MSNIAFDAPKSPESYEDFGVSSLDSDSIQKEASAQVLSEILADFGKESETEEKTASDKVAQEEKVKEEDKKEEEKEEKKEEKEEKEEKAKGKGAEDLALEKTLEKDASAYYDLGRWLAFDKVAEQLNEAGEVDVKTSAAIKLHVAGLTDSLVA